MASGVGAGSVERGKTQFSLKSWPLGIWSFSSEYMGNTNWTGRFFCLFIWVFWGREGRGYKVDLEEQEKSVTEYIAQILK